MEQNYEMIVTIVNRGFSDYVVDASREAGASGGTILYARGTNINEATDSFMGMEIRPEKDIILTVVSGENRNKVMKNITEKAHLDVEGRGICFSMPVSDIRGINFAGKKPKK